MKSSQVNQSTQLKISPEGLPAGNQYLVMLSKEKDSTPLKANAYA